jgi:polyprenyl P-hydroxybenzoate/phenylacrylic acid decarboxylase-like protein
MPMRMIRAGRKRSSSHSTSTGLAQDLPAELGGKWRTPASFDRATGELSREADVCLKERRGVVFLLRETPLHAGYIALMDQARRNGAIIMPSLPAFYAQPKRLDDIADQTVGRTLDLFGIDVKVCKRWRDAP